MKTSSNKLAVIDIGTNSILYLLAKKISQRNIEILEQEFVSVRLGHALDQQGEIQHERVSKTIEVLDKYHQKAKSENADVIVVATHVLRSAKNRSWVCGVIEKETGLHINIISETEEAKFSFLGAVFGRNTSDSVLVMDIGGGSTEIVSGSLNNTIDVKSVPIGAVSLTEQYLHHDPQSETELKTLHKNAMETFKNKAGKILSQGNHIIGVGGTVTTLAALSLKLKKYDANRVDGTDLSRKQIISYIALLKQLSLAEKKVLLTLDPKRADILLAGTMILDCLMEISKAEKITVSDRGLRFGIALKALDVKSIN